VVFFKLELILFFEDLRSAAKAALIPKLAVLDHLEEFCLRKSRTTLQRTYLHADKYGRRGSLPGADEESLTEANAARQDFISSAGRYGIKSRTPNPKKISDHVVNRTDPDACPWLGMSKERPVWATRSTTWWTAAQS
jgi:hypothetical protein